MLLIVSAYLECDFWSALFKTVAFITVLELRIFWFTEHLDHMLFLSLLCSWTSFTI